MGTLQTSLKEDKELSEQFKRLGEWAEEVCIGDWPVLGGDSVSPLYAFSKIIDTSKEEGRDRNIPRDILWTLERMKDFGYGKGDMLSIFVAADIKHGEYWFSGGDDFIHDVRSIALESESKEEFEKRYDMLDRAFALHMQARVASWDTLKNAQR